MLFTRKTWKEICLTMFLYVQFSIIIGLIKQCLWVCLTLFMLHQRWGSGPNTWWSCCCCHLIITVQWKSYLPFAFFSPPLLTVFTWGNLLLWKCLYVRIQEFHVELPRRLQVMKWRSFPKAAPYLLWARLTKWNWTGPRATGAPVRGLLSDSSFAALTSRLPKGHVLFQSKQHSLSFPRCLCTSPAFSCTPCLHVQKDVEDGGIRGKLSCCLFTQCETFLLPKGFLPRENSKCRI